MGKKKVTTTTVVEEIVDDGAKNAAFILLDRSGSMGLNNKWIEAIGSINAYVEGLKKLAPTARVTLAAFDTQEYLTLRESVQVKNWVDLRQDCTYPRGGTPLYDSMAKMIDHAEKASPDRAIFVVMTDGEENSSHEFNKTSIRQKVDRLKSHGWDIVFLGADFGDTDDAVAMGLDYNKFIRSSLQNMSDTMALNSFKTAAYFATSDMARYTDEEKARAAS